MHHRCEVKIARTAEKYEMAVDMSLVVSECYFDVVRPHLPVSFQSVHMPQGACSHDDIASLPVKERKFAW